MGQSLAIPRVIPNDWKRLDLIINKIKMRLGSAASPTFAGLTVTGLTASTLVGADADKALESVTIGTGLDYTRPTLSLSHLGIEALTDPGADKILFWDDSTTACKWLGVGNSIAITTTTIDTIQDIRTSASPTFAGLTLTNAAVIGSNSVVFQSNTDSTTFFQVLDADGGIPILNIDSTNERIGIGIAAPGWKFDVLGQALLLGSDAADATLRTDGTNKYGRFFTPHHNNAEEPLAAFVAESNAITGNIVKFGGGTFYGNKATVLHFITGPTSTTQAGGADTGDFIIKNGNATVADGNFGIGIADPDDVSSKFRIEDDVSFRLDVLCTETNSRVLFELKNDTDGNFIQQAVYGSTVAGTTFGSNIAGNAVLAGSSGIVMYGNQDASGQVIIGAGNTEAIRVTSGHNVGFGETAPETAIELTKAAPYFTFHNSTHEDGDGGRESRIIFKGEQSGGEETILARIEASHDGSSDDQLGKYIVSVNTGAGLAQALEIGSDLLATFVGSIVSANYTAANLLTACATNAGALNFSAASKTITVEDNTIVSQDYSSDATPLFSGISLSGIIEGHAGDNFLVLAVSTVKYRTGAQVLSDIGAQPLDAGLTSLAALGYVSDSMIKITAEDTYTIRTMAEVRTDLGLVIGTNVQAYDAELTSLAALTYVAASFVKMTGANTFALRTIGETADDLEATIDHDNLANGGAHDYAYISGNDGATGITAAELEELSDGSETTLHSHAAFVGDNPTRDDSQSNAMLKAHAYLTQTAGFVNAFTTQAVGENLSGYVGTTSDPAGAGVKVDYSIVTTENASLSISFYVASGKYFEITSTGTVTITWTPFVAGGGAPIDQD